MVGRGRRCCIGVRRGRLGGAGCLPTTNASCPTGQVADDEDPDFNCQPDCPDGMLVDAVTGTCVAAPGVPPPPLGGGEPRTAVG